MSQNCEQEEMRNDLRGVRTMWHLREIAKKDGVQSANDIWGLGKEDLIEAIILARGRAAATNQPKVSE